MNRRQGRRARRPAAKALVFSLLETADALEARLEAALTPAGLSLAKLGVLHHLAEAKRPLPLSELAKYEQCVRSNITQMVDRLEKEGLVRRRPDRDDRRSVRAAVTAAGARAYARGMRALAKAERAIVSPLDAGRAVRLKDALAVLTR